MADAVVEIGAQRRRRFDAAVVDAFLAVLPELDLDLDGGAEPRVEDVRAAALSV